MLTLPPSVHIYLATEPIDLRRGHDGLFAIVRNQWRMDPFAGHLYAFVGRRGNRVKIRLPRIREGATSITLDATQLGMLLDGIDVEHVRRAKHWTPPAASSRAVHG